MRPLLALAILCLGVALAVALHVGHHGHHGQRKGHHHESDGTPEIEGGTAIVKAGNKTLFSTGIQYKYGGARAHCNVVGQGRMATPENSAENDAILTLRNHFGVNPVLGVNDYKEEGTFRDLSGDALSYTNWKVGEPNNHEDQDCVEMDADGKWNVMSCSEVRLVVCED